MIIEDYSVTKAALLENTDVVFTSTSYEHRTYSFQELSSLRDKALINTPDSYLRRLKGMPEIFKAATFYQRDMTEYLVSQWLGKARQTPLNLLETNILSNNPTALKIAAIIYQLGRDVNMTPSIPLEMMEPIKGMVRVVPSEVGEITIQSLNEVSIAKDLILVESLEGAKLATYRVDHFITVEEPSLDGSIECHVTRTFRPESISY